MPESKNPLRIGAGYIRVSTDDQTEYSPDSQIKLIREYAKAHGILIPDAYIFREDEGISGRKAERRPEFQKMIATAKNPEHPFDVILVWKFSRFARNQEESIVYKSLLRKQCNVEVISISEPLIDGPFGTLIERIIEWMDEYYSIRLAGEVKRGMKEKVSRGGIVSVPAFGYDIKDGKYIQNESEATYVREMYRQFMNGSGLVEIAKFMNAAGVRTKRGKLWENRTVEYILNNPVYNGKIRWNPAGITSRNYDDENIMIVQGTHQPILSDEEWSALQAHMQEYKNINRKYVRYTLPTFDDFMLRGIMKCSTCGRTLTRVNGDGLQCSNYMHGRCPRSHYISFSIANALVLSYLENALSSGNFVLVQKQDKKNKEITDTITKQIKKEKEKLSRAKEAYLAGIDTLQEYERNKKRISEEICRLQATVPIDIDIEKEKKAFAKKHLESLKTLKDPNVAQKEKNILLKSFVSQIIFHRSTCTIEVQFYF